MSKIYSQAELRGMTRLRLRDVCKELRIPCSNFNNQTYDELTSLILQAQSERESSAIAQTQEPQSNAQRLAAAPQPKAGMVRVISGASAAVFPIAGCTIRSALADLHQTLNIDPNAQPYVNGQTASLDHVLQEGEQLEMAKKSGDKAL